MGSSGHALHVMGTDFDGPEGLGDDAQDGNPREVGELGERLREVDPEVLGDASRGHVPRRKPCPAAQIACARRVRP